MKRLVPEYTLNSEEMNDYVSRLINAGEFDRLEKVMAKNGIEPTEEHLRSAANRRITNSHTDDEKMWNLMSTAMIENSSNPGDTRAAIGNVVGEFKGRLGRDYDLESDRWSSSREPNPVEMRILQVIRDLNGMWDRAAVPSSAKQSSPSASAPAATPIVIH